MRREVMADMEEYGSYTWRLDNDILDRIEYVEFTHRDMPLVDELMGADEEAPTLEDLYATLQAEGTDIEAFVAEGMEHIDEIGVFETHGMKLRTADLARLTDMDNSAAVEAALMGPAAAPAAAPPAAPARPDPALVADRLAGAARRIRIPRGKAKA